MIDLKNLAGAAGWSFDGTTLAVHFASGPDADLNLAGSDLSASTDFALSVDASGTGADIVIAPPAPVISAPANGSTIANAVIHAITGTGENGDIVTVKIDGAVAGTALVSAGAWSFTPPSPLSNATHSVTATRPVRRERFRACRTPVVFHHVDTATPPAPVIRHAARTCSTIANADPAITGTGENGDVVTVKIDGAVAGTALVSAGAWSFTPASSLSAPHTVTATEANAAGTVSAVSNIDSFTINTSTPPAPVISVPANGSTIANADPASSALAGLAQIQMTVTIDGTVASTALLVSSGAWSFTPSTPLSNATHSVTATEANAAGTASAVSNTDSFTVNAGGGVAVTINPVDGDSNVSTMPRLTPRAACR